MHILAQHDTTTLWQDLGNAQPWQWVVAAALLTGALLVGGVIASLLRQYGARLRDAEPSSRLRAAYPLLGIFLYSLASPLVVLLIAAALYAGTLTLTGGQWNDTPAMRSWRSMLQVLAALAVGWFLHRLVRVVDYYLLRRTKRSDKPLNPQVIPLVRKTLQTLVVIVTALFIAQNILHWEIAAMLTALGIGGLAIALAAQQTIANLFGSVTIFADRPFQLSDTIRFRSYIGQIEDVGFRSTRIRTTDGTVVTVPNSAIANEPVETLGYCPGLRQDFTVTVKNTPKPPRTPAELAMEAVRIVQGVLDERRPKLLDRPLPRVCLQAMSGGTFTIAVQYWFHLLDGRDLALFHQEVLVETLRRLNVAGLELA